MNWDHVHSSPRKDPSIGQTLLSDPVSLKQIVVVFSFPGDVVLIQVSENGRTNHQSWGCHIFREKTTTQQQVCHEFQDNGSSKKRPLPLIFCCALSNSCSVLYSLRVRTQLRLPIFQGTVGIVWYCLFGVKTIYSWVISMVTNHRIGY